MSLYNSCVKLHSQKHYIMVCLHVCIQAPVFVENCYHHMHNVCLAYQL